MSKKLIVLLLSTLGMQAMSATAGTPQLSMQCDPPVLQVAANVTNPLSQYIVLCKGAELTSIAPVIRYSGELNAGSTSPYLITASYNINVQSARGRQLNQIPRVDQIAVGALRSSAVSAAALPAQFAAQTIWDASSGTLSIEETAGQWRAFTVDYANSADEPSVTEAGVASVPVRAGQALVRVELGQRYSRFSGKTGNSLPIVTAELRLRNGKLEVQLGETRAANQKAVQSALLALDRQPKDITRAWALAAIARFLGLDDEVHYAEQKIAAHHPNLLEEFQLSVARIEPYVPPLQ